MKALTAKDTDADESDSSSQSQSSQDLSDLNGNDLKRICKAIGIKATGKKPDLCRRLQSILDGEEAGEAELREVLLVYLSLSLSVGGGAKGIQFFTDPVRSEQKRPAREWGNVFVVLFD